jgi:fructosamine-3-kinase
MLPAALLDAVAARLGPLGEARPVAGGCISSGCRLDTGDGPVFLKYRAGAPAGFFAAEADGLRALHHAAAEALRVPDVLALEDGDRDVPAWLAIEWLEPGRRGADFDARLGRGLAALHGAPAAGWGWEADNYIGSLPQANAPTAGWPAFWRTRRLEPQMDLARRAGRLPATEAEWTRLLDALPDRLGAASEADGPSQLHGDLWSGNVLAAAEGPALIDPSAYRGHREVDLAMAELFGGFGAGFHAAYGEARPLRPGYPRRRPVYQLYYLLVHVNLFGGGYVEQTAATLRHALAD